ncbi:MAG: DinB family protein [Anaerolineae bacterium]
MAAGEHECRNARDTDLKRAIEVGLDEAMTALEEALSGLTDEHLWAFPLPGRNNIAWIAMHCLDNLDDCGVEKYTGRRLYPSEWRWDLWGAAAEDRPKPGDEFPGVAEVLARLAAIRQAAAEALAGADEQSLRRPVDDPEKSVAADWYVRTTYHTAAHVRQIWLLRGALGLAGGAWPGQHWW